jgi:hypothetical protein
MQVFFPVENMININVDCKRLQLVEKLFSYILNPTITSDQMLKNILAISKQYPYQTYD